LHGALRDTNVIGTDIDRLRRVTTLRTQPWHTIRTMALEPGTSREHDFTVEGPLLTDVGGTIGISVLSTPGMVAMIERNAAMLVYPELPEGKATVGFEICVKHVAGAGEGALCTTRAELKEIVDGRKLRFDVEVREGKRTIGVGTHERRVIEVPPAANPT
jgi:predicted thioesterase